jgi:hypothetical protein
LSHILLLCAELSLIYLQFHPEKCISLSVTRSQKPFHTSYILKGHTLESLTTAKYLGITISKDMNWDFVTYLAALRWTCSNLLFSFSVWGDQTLAQYSRFDLTMDLYAKVLVSVFWIGRFRLRSTDKMSEHLNILVGL